MPSERNHACRRCRSIKNKCSGELSGCLRCVGRGLICVYDEARNKRGPDKAPRKFGGPVRSVPRIKPVEPSHVHSELVPNMEKSANQPAPFASPSLEYYRVSWWELVLHEYNHDRHEAFRAISEDLTAFFQNCHHMFCFFHIPSFFSRIARPDTREKLQPSLMLSFLALSSLMQSNQPSRRHKRKRAMSLIGWAHSAFSASLAAQWIDIELVQAAMLLAVFESCPHPLQDESKQVETMHQLDDLISVLKLPQIDADIPGASCLKTARHGDLITSLRGIHTTDRTRSELSHGATSRTISLTTSNSGPPTVFDPVTGSYQAAQFTVSTECSCRLVSLGETSRSSVTSRGMQSSAGWEPSATGIDIAREEGRRIVWAAIGLFSGHAVHRAAAQLTQIVWNVTSGTQFCVLFPGEVQYLTHGDALSGKNTIWAIYCRAYLLWHASLRLSNMRLSNAERAHMVYSICLETDRLKELLDEHTCGLETHLLHAGRLFLHFAKFTVTAVFRNCALDPYAGPLSYQRQAAGHWVAGLMGLIRRSNRLENMQELARSVSWNPWLAWILIDQILRLLQLWDSDPTLTDVLHLAKRIQQGLDATIEIFSPAPCIGEYAEKIAVRLNRALAMSSVVPLVQKPTQKESAGWELNVLSRLQKLSVSNSPLAT